MTLALKIAAQRAEKVRRQMDEDARHGRSRFPEIEADGADDFAHRYPASACPYANTATTDAHGQIIPTGDEMIQKAAAWRRGWRQAAQENSAKIGSDRMRFWDLLAASLTARGVKTATFTEANDFFASGYTTAEDAERVAFTWSADQ